MIVNTDYYLVECALLANSQTRRPYVGPFFGAFKAWYVICEWKQHLPWLSKIFPMSRSCFCWLLCFIYFSAVVLTWLAFRRAKLVCWATVGVLQDHLFFVTTVWFCNNGNLSNDVVVVPSSRLEGLCRLHHQALRRRSDLLVWALLGEEQRQNPRRHPSAHGNVERSDYSANSRGSRTLGWVLMDFFCALFSRLSHVVGALLRLFGNDHEPQRVITSCEILVCWKRGTCSTEKSSDPIIPQILEDSVRWDEFWWISPMSCVLDFPLCGWAFCVCLAMIMNRSAVSNRAKDVGKEVRRIPRRHPSAHGNIERSWVRNKNESKDETKILLVNLECQKRTFTLMEIL